jgi:hypothetical protein
MQTREIIRCSVCHHARAKHWFTDLRGLRPEGSYYGACYLRGCDCPEFQSDEAA